MSGPVQPTEHRLVDAAERLFAERGIDAVSLRTVMAAAGTNVASVHYHFGSKEALVAALVRRRSDVVAARRAELLDALEAADSVTARGLAEAFVQPVWEMASGDGARWVKLVAGLIGSNHPALAVVAEGFTPQARRFMRLLPRAVPDLAPATARFRLTQAMALSFQVLGDLPQTQSLLAISRVRLSRQQVLDELLDVVTAILAGPPPQ